MPPRLYHILSLSTLYSRFYVSSDRASAQKPIRVCGWARWLGHIAITSYGCVGRSCDAHTPYILIFWVCILCYWSLFSLWYGMAKLYYLWVRGRIRCTYAIFFTIWVFCFYGFSVYLTMRWLHTMLCYYTYLQLLRCKWIRAYCVRTNAIFTAINGLLGLRSLIFRDAQMPVGACLLFIMGVWSIGTHTRHLVCLQWFWYGSIILLFGSEGTLSVTMHLVWRLTQYHYAYLYFLFYSLLSTTHPCLCLVIRCLFYGSITVCGAWVFT
jgi:hypothetical protein